MRHTDRSLILRLLYFISVLSDYNLIPDVGALSEVTAALPALNFNAALICS